MSKAKAQADQLADKLSSTSSRSPAIPDSDMLSTGCTLLNLALTGRPFGGVPKGCYLSLVGDSGSMKSWTSFCLFAEAAINPNFKGYSFVFDNAENGALMDVEGYFGKGVARRLAPPCQESAGSTTVQEFYYNVEANVRRGPCIYVLDSMDALQDEADDANFEAKMHYHETGRGADKVKGSMGVGKAKTNSSNISRIANSTLRSNGSILVIISQTRDLMNSPYPGMKTFGGGKALKFYSHLQAWTKVKAPIKKYYKGKDREVGSLISIDVQKNRVSGWEGNVPLISFLKGHGVDDIGSCCDYLLEEKHWKKAAAGEESRPAKKSTSDPDDSDLKMFAAPEFDFVGTREEFVQRVQETSAERKLSELAGSVWRDIATAASPVRKPRY